MLSAGVTEKPAPSILPRSPVPDLSFVTNLRPHVKLPVTSLERSVPFYRALFNRAPVELVESFVRFEPINPSVNFVLVKDPVAATRDGHFGIQLKYTKDIEKYRERLERVGAPITLEEAETACCFSVSNKVWANDPDGNLWEIFVVTAENASSVRCGSSCACEAGGCV